MKSTIKMNSKNMFRVNYDGLIHIAQLAIEEGIEVLHLWNYKTWNKTYIDEKGNKQPCKPVEFFADILEEKECPISICNF